MDISYVMNYKSNERIYPNKRNINSWKITIFLIHSCVVDPRSRKNLDFKINDRCVW